MPIPKVQALLLPVLKVTEDGAEHSVEEIRKRIIEQFKLTRKEVEQEHPKSGKNVFVNLVAFALAYLNMGRAIIRKKEGVYQIAERGAAILKGNPTDLTIAEASDSGNQ